MSDSQPNGSQSSTILPLTYVVDACERFEIEWRGGRHPRIEAYLESVEPASATICFVSCWRSKSSYGSTRREPDPRTVPLEVPGLGPCGHGRFREGPLGGGGGAGGDRGAVDCGG